MDLWLSRAPYSAIGGPSILGTWKRDSPQGSTDVTTWKILDQFDYSVWYSKYAHNANRTIWLLCHDLDNNMLGILNFKLVIWYFFRVYFSIHNLHMRSLIAWFSYYSLSMQDRLPAIFSGQGYMVNVVPDHIITWQWTWCFRVVH